jgi:hypothetical protein
MRAGSLVCTAALLTALSPFSLAADEVAWGLPVDGLRLGISLDRSLPQPTFRVLLQNTTKLAVDIQVALRTSAGDHYAISLFVIEPDGVSHGLFDSRHPAGGIAGKASPLIIRIEPGGDYELLFPCGKLSLVEDGKRVAVQVLLDRGWAIQARGLLLVSGQFPTPKQ